MTQVLFQPAGSQGSRDHYRDTIEQPVPFARLEQFLDPSVTSQLRSLVKADAVATWGVTPGRNSANLRKWERIVTGDVAVFLREGRAYSSGVVALTARNAPLAEDLWGRDEFGQTWEYLYFLRDVRPCDVSYRDLNRAARYEPENRFQGFNILDPGRAPEVIQLLGRDSFSGRVWWVYQGTTYEQERAGEFLWAPTTSKQGAALAQYRNVMRLKPGDTVLHYAAGIRAVGRVEEPPSEAARPADSPHGSWNADGYLARVSYRDLAEAIPITSIPDEWRQEEASLDSPRPHPFSRDGGVVVGYLYELSDSFVQRLRTRFPHLFSEGTMDSNPVDKLSGAFAAALRDTRLVYSDADVARFVAALLTKPLVILSGLSGSGKTKLAQALGYWLGRGDDGLCASVVPVGPDWTSVDSTLGYPNALDPTRYSMTEVLKCVLDANARPELPHILVLDEMNLSHVERYFADILSAMESGEQITLYSDSDPRGQVPKRLTWPRNMFVVGTVNVDETTYMFSPKVLDRANVIEFRVDPSRLVASGNGTSPVDLLKIEGQGARFARLFVDRTWIPVLPPDVESRTRAELAIFFDVLSKEGHEFGYRTASEIARFVAVHRALLGGAWTFDASFDAQVIQKLLPRVHGSRRSIASTLIALAVLCSEPREWIDARIANFDLIKGRAEDEAAMGDDLGDVGSRFEASIGQAPYKLSLDKVVRMLKRLDRNGFVSFAEA